MDFPFRVCVAMDADEDISLGFVGGIGSAMKLHEDIGVPDEHGEEERVFFEGSGELESYRKGDVFFFVDFAGCAGVLAPMPGIDNHPQGLKHPEGSKAENPQKEKAFPSAAHTAFWANLRKSGFAEAGIAPPGKHFSCGVEEDKKRCGELGCAHKEGKIAGREGGKEQLTYAGPVKKLLQEERPRK